MRKFAASVALVALLLGVAAVSTPSRAETGQVAVVFTKGGFIIGVGGGEGVLVFRGKRYPFTVSGMSVGFTIGASTTKLVGRASICRGRLQAPTVQLAPAEQSPLAPAAFNCRTPMA